MVPVPLLLRSLIRRQDLVWLLLFAALAFVSSHPTRQEIGLLLCLGAFQVIESRIGYFNTPRGSVASVLIKLALCYLLIGWTGGISSSYYVILLMPVMAGANSLGLTGALLTTAAACASYLSFLLPVFFDYSRFELTFDAVGEIGQRLVFLPVVAFLTWQNVQEIRDARRGYEVAAKDLETANQNLQAAEAEARRSERLAALGQLTAGLAHELRNPLGTMRASAEMLERNLPAHNALATEMAGFIRTEVDRTNSLITRFLDFARPVRLQLQETDITRVIDSAIAEFQRHSPTLPVSVHRNYLPELPPIQGDAELLQRVFYNLILNAAQFSPPNSSVTVKVRPTGEFLQIDVIDRGSGIAPKDLEQIFNPFFTRRSDGVGLGLAIVSRIVDDHGGSMLVDSEPSHGTVFHVFLPHKPVTSHRPV